jgi:hypothetical protein
MSISPARTNTSGWLRIALPLVVGSQALAACETTPVKNPALEIVHKPPIAIGPQGTESIAFKRVIVEVPPGTVVGAHWDGLLKVKQAEHIWDPDLTDGNAQLNFAGSDELRRLGYSVVGNDKDLFSEERASKPRFLIGARIQRLSYDTYGPTCGNCCTARVDVEWQVFDTATNEVVLTQAGAGGARLDGYEAPIVKKAFVAALADLTSNEKFVSLVRTRPTP